MEERLWETHPCTNCRKVSDCGECWEYTRWSEKALGALQEYGIAEEEGRLALLPVSFQKYQENLIEISFVFQELLNDGLIMGYGEIEETLLNYNGSSAAFVEETITDLALAFEKDHAATEEYFSDIRDFARKQLLAVFAPRTDRKKEEEEPLSEPLPITRKVKAARELCIAQIIDRVNARIEGARALGKFEANFSCSLKDADGPFCDEVKERFEDAGYRFRKNAAGLEWIMW